RPNKSGSAFYSLNSGGVYVPRAIVMNESITPPTMSKPCLKSSVVVGSVFAALAGAAAFGQAVSAPPEPKDETPVKLDPFNVSADSDVGFVAATSLAGGRIASALKDTPVAYSVMTKEFLDAFNITDISQAAQFSVGSNYYEGDGSNQGFANGP